MDEQVNLEQCLEPNFAGMDSNLDFGLSGFSDMPDIYNFSPSLSDDLELQVGLDAEEDYLFSDGILNLDRIPLEWDPEKISLSRNNMQISVKNEPGTPPSPTGSSDSGCWPKTETETPPVSPPRVVVPKFQSVVMLPQMNFVPVNGRSKTAKRIQPKPAEDIKARPIKIEWIPGQETVTSTTDMRLLKKHQRMIKNRESACQSRKKKKEYLTTLETQISRLLMENKQLRCENEELKAQLAKHEGPRGKKGVITLCACLMLVAFNPLSVFQPSDLPDPVVQHPVRSPAGRSLLWMGDSKPKALPRCPVAINQTESDRLNSQLRGCFSTNSSRVERVPRPAAKKKLRKSSAVALYGPHEALFDAIGRRDDFFYVFSTEHVLRAAKAHNVSSRPKVALVLPTVNASVPSHKVALLQVECEVIDTRAFAVDQRLMPNATATARRWRRDFFGHN
ncbi:Hypothetical predicted protein [Cloeon dipterum]|uniref:BZIP domain-containing protein n=1 Tax=Cloeon dipterum TaxID=197152 RepID=A0A8S1C3K7_9INSE|nr:Hypothetical predicted protein [Cloeon dipterum]